MSKGESDAVHPGNAAGYVRSGPVAARAVSRRDADLGERFWRRFAACWRIRSRGGGQGLYFLSATVTSPTMAAQWQQGQKNYPQAKFVQYDPVNRDSHYRASKQAFGQFVDAQYKLDQADVIVSLDADFLGGAHFPGFHKLARDYAQKRQAGAGTDQMNRLYVVETVTTTTGFKAEHRLAVKPSQMAAFAQSLAALSARAERASGNWSDHDSKYLQGVAADLKASGGKSVVIPGEFAPPEVHLAAFAINQALGNVGKTVVYTEP